MLLFFRIPLFGSPRWGTVALMSVSNRAHGQVVMCLYLAAVGSAYMELEATDSDRFLPAAVGVNLAWLSVATCLNAVIAAERLGYGGEITAPSKRLPSPAGTPELAVAAMVALTAMAFAALHARRDWPFAATIAWALRGIQRGQLEQEY